MCIAVLRRGTGQLACYETRDQGIWRPHGAAAGLQLGYPVERPFDNHWYQHARLVDQVWTVSGFTGPDPKLRNVYGGLDAGGGTWLAVNRETGVYARVFVAPTAAGLLGEANSHSARTAAVSTGMVSRSGLSLDAVTGGAAHESACSLLPRLQARLTAAGKYVLPFFLLVADAKSAHLISYCDHTQHSVTDIEDYDTHVISVFGLDSSHSVLSNHVLCRSQLLPTPAASDHGSWDPWIVEIGGTLHQGDYDSAGWRAHRFGAYNLPYLNVSGPLRHAAARRPVAVDTALVEWTKSSSCVVIGSSGIETLLFDERHALDLKVLDEPEQAARFPQRSSDFIDALAASTEPEPADA